MKKYFNVLGIQIPRIVFLITGYFFTLYGLFTEQHLTFQWSSSFYCGLFIIAMYYIFSWIENRMGDNKMKTATKDTDEEEKIARVRGMTLKEHLNDIYPNDNENGFGKNNDGELMTDDEEEEMFEEWKRKKNKLHEQQEQIEEQVEIW